MEVVACAIMVARGGWRQHMIRRLVVSEIASSPPVIGVSVSW